MQVVDFYHKDTKISTVNTEIIFVVSVNVLCVFVVDPWILINFEIHFYS